MERLLRSGESGDPERAPRRGPRALRSLRARLPPTRTRPRRLGDDRIGAGPRRPPVDPAHRAAPRDRAPSRSRPASLHARADQVIPFSETLRTAKWLGSRCDSLSTRLTGLFTHSGEDIEESLWRRGLSNLDFLGALTGVFEAAG